MRTIFTFAFRGLDIMAQGDFEHSDSEYPGCNDVEILSLTLVDETELLSYGIMETFSAGTEEMARRLMQMTGKLFPAMTAHIMSEWHDEMGEEASEEFSSLCC